MICNDCGDVHSACSVCKKFTCEIIACMECDLSLCYNCHPNSEIHDKWIFICDSCDYSICDICTFKEDIYCYPICGKFYCSKCIKDNFGEWPVCAECEKFICNDCRVDCDNCKESCTAICKECTEAKCKQVKEKYN